MKNGIGKILQKSRIVSQIAFLILFLYLFYYTISSANLFFYFDPFIALSILIASGSVTSLFLLSIVTIVFTLIFGRVFCGWICPFGAIHQFFSWLNKKKVKKNDAIDKQLPKIKYLILIALMVSSVIGANLSGWLDPFSILTRSAAAIASPVNYLLNQALAVGADEGGILSAAAKPVYNFARQNILAKNIHYSSQSILLPGLFIFFLLMNFYKRRFFCNTVCPLGALLGLVSRFSLLTIKATSKCKSCGSCSKNCTYNGNADNNYNKSECTMCFNCTTDCPTEAVEIKFEIPKMNKRTKIDLGKRKLIGSVITGLAIASLPKTSIQAKSKVRHTFLRPPGALKEEEFLSKCTRCGNCTQSCPTNFIQPAFLESGFEGLWTPILNAQTGWCSYNCNECAQVCSTQALKKITLKQKQQFKIGTAVVDKNKCYTYSSGFNCTVCYDKCPTEQKAIALHQVESWSFMGKYSTVNQIYVLPDLCIGCGICQNVCPRKDSPGIIVTSEDEIREVVTGDV